MLDLAQQFAELGYSVSVKPHPMEPKEILKRQLQSLELKRIKIIEDSNVLSEEKLQFLSTKHYLTQMAKIKTARIPHTGEAAL